MIASGLDETPTDVAVLRFRVLASSQTEEGHEALVRGTQKTRSPAASERQRLIGWISLSSSWRADMTSDCS